MRNKGKRTNYSGRNSTLTSAHITYSIVRAITRSKRIENSKNLIKKHTEDDIHNLIIGGQDTCQGDSGGPLWVEEDGVGLRIRQMGKNSGHFSGHFFSAILVGLVARGRGCAKQNYPGIYTR